MITTQGTHALDLLKSRRDELPRSAADRFPLVSRHDPFHELIE
jgi:hypothetical protein